MVTVAKVRTRVKSSMAEFIGSSVSRVLHRVRTQSEAT